MTRPEDRLTLRSESQDPRAIRTRKALVQAAIDHLREHRADEMSVSRIAKDAGVSRQVFYQHFADLDALVFTAGQEILGGAYQHFADNFNTAEDFGGAVSALTSNLAGDYSVIINLIDSPVHANLDAYLYEIALPTLRDAIKVYLAERDVEYTEELVALMARFFVAGAQELLEDGARRGLKTDELAARVQAVTDVLSIR